MMTHYTYWFDSGEIWELKQTGIIRSKFEPVRMSRESAERLLAQYTKSAKTTDYFTKHAELFRDELEEAIRDYDNFQITTTPKGYGTGKEKINDHHFPESAA